MVRGKKRKQLRVFLELKHKVNFFQRWGDKIVTNEESEDRKLMGNLVSTLKSFASLVQPPQKKETGDDAEGEEEINTDELRKLTVEQGEKEKFTKFRSLRKGLQRN